MKKNAILFIYAFVLVSIITSCTSTNKGYQSSPVVSRNVQLDPIKADIKVAESKKLSGESSSLYFLFIRLTGDNTAADGITYNTDVSSSVLSKLNPINNMKMSKLNKVRASAAYKALENGDYDFLVSPTYSITTNNLLFGIIKQYSCSVTGYGAKYQNFRTEKQKVIITNSGKEYVFPDNN